MAIQHQRQDAFDAYGRSRSGYRPGWHPILSAVESEPGHWELVSQQGTRYAVIRLLEIGGERGYRVVTWAPASSDRQLIGYYRTLRAAAAAGHRRWLASLSRPGGINGSV